MAAERGEEPSRNSTSFTLLYLVKNFIKIVNVCRRKDQSASVAPGIFALFS